MNLALTFSFIPLCRFFELLLLDFLQLQITLPTKCIGFFLTTSSRVDLINWKAKPLQLIYLSDLDLVTTKVIFNTKAHVTYVESSDCLVTLRWSRYSFLIGFEHSRNAEVTVRLIKNSLLVVASLKNRKLEKNAFFSMAHLFHKIAIPIIYFVQ